MNHAGINAIESELERLTAKDDLSFTMRRFSGQLGIIGAVFALPENIREQIIFKETLTKHIMKDCKSWPYWWVPKNNDRITNLKISGALIAAEIERLSREGYQWLEPTSDLMEVGE